MKEERQNRRKSQNRNPKPLKRRGGNCQKCQNCQRSPKLNSKILKCVFHPKNAFFILKCVLHPEIRSSILKYVLNCHFWQLRRFWQCLRVILLVGWSERPIFAESGMEWFQRFPLSTSGKVVTLP